MPGPSRETADIILLEDSLPLLRRFARIIETWPHGRVIGAFSSVEQAIAAIGTTKVDILVADLNLPDGSGIDAIHALRSCHPEAHAVVVSVLSEGPTVLEAIKAGASGYILKDDTSFDFIHALEMTLDGKSPMSPTIARQIIESIRGAPDPAARESADQVKIHLTPRERDVLTAIARGFSCREVSEMLGLSVQTVPVHIRNIYRKLDATNRSEAVFEAQRQGLIQP
ncbi:DNA-binding response regulator [Zhengella mangrovi]|uniref:DNA-binding response regulator n=1 Tax=Zhengella mangrovi TaxID=1982044 RepID=A0A2G1QQI1_9HYPH|nr:response regulator transcription factor [Zhengella mangrovi]PHP67827.1 DNA-binding response regulator [Zhengella mangrovi]